MKLSISTLPCKDWTLEKTLEICKENHISGLEIRLGLNSWSDMNMGEEQCTEILKMIEEYDMCITNLGTSIVIKTYQPDSMEELKECIQLADKLNTKGLRIMLGDFWYRWSDSMEEIEYDGMCRWLKEADHLVGMYGKELWIETHNEFATGRSLYNLQKELNLQNMKFIWDILHPIEQEEEPIETLTYLKDDLVHIHIKDGTPWEDKDLANWKYTKVGEGALPIKEILTMLQKEGYEGYYSLEWESLWRAEIRGEEYVGELIIPEFTKYMFSGID